MFFRVWRLITIVLIALSMGVAEAHLLEMPAKRGYSGAEWLHLLQTLYPPAFGTAGAAFEVGAVLAVLVLAVLVRHRSTFPWTLAAATCMVTAHAVFWIWVAPVNAALLPLTPETLPPDWAAFRDQWEYGHAVRALLQLSALGALVWSLLREIPADVVLTSATGVASHATAVENKSFAPAVRRP